MTLRLQRFGPPYHLNNCSLVIPISTFVRVGARGIGTVAHPYKEIQIRIMNIIFIMFKI